MNRELEKLKTIKFFNFVISNFTFKAVEINDIVKKNQKPKVFLFYYFLKRKREKRRSKSPTQVEGWKWLRVAVHEQKVMGSNFDVGTLGVGWQWV